MNTKTRPSTLHWQPALQRPEEYVCGLDDIHQAIHIILRTPRGSDPHRPLLAAICGAISITRSKGHSARCSGVGGSDSHVGTRCRLLKVTPTIDGEHLTLRVMARRRRRNQLNGGVMAIAEPDFIDRDPAQITSEMIAQYEEASGKKTLSGAG